MLDLLFHVCNELLYYVGDRIKVGYDGSVPLEDLLRTEVVCRYTKRSPVDIGSLFAEFVRRRARNVSKITMGCPLCFTFVIRTRRLSTIAHPRLDST